MPGPSPFISSKRRLARGARRGEVGRKEAPSGFCFKAERKHFGAAACAGFGWGLRRERGAPGGDCGTSTASRAPPALGSRQPEGALPDLPPTRPLTPGGATPWTSKGIKAREGRATGHNFSSPPAPPPSCFVFGY